MEENIKVFLKVNSGDGYGEGSGYGDGYGYGSGSGYGDGSGDGYGDGDGSGYGSGSGSGYGDGSGSGSGEGYGYGEGSGSGSGEGYGDGSGYGSGEGYGDGSGYGDGYGYGYGDGDGDGDGCISFCNDKIYYIDGVPTIIKQVRGNIAKGFILNDDLTLTPCYIAKSGNYFAHGETLKKAIADAEKKRMNNLSIEEREAMFKEKFKEGQKYSGHEFFEWHGILTGSCEMGRRSFVENKGINLENTFTVEEFVELVKDQYGGKIFRGEQ